MNNYQKKKDALYYLQVGQCAICQRSLKYSQDFPDLHHKLRNTKGNRKKFPLLIDSLLNLQLIHHNCHINRHGSAGKMSDIQAREYENFLEKHPKFCRMVNCE